MWLEIRDLSKHILDKVYRVEATCIPSLFTRLKSYILHPYFTNWNDTLIIPHLCVPLYFMSFRLLHFTSKCCWDPQNMPIWILYVPTKLCAMHPWTTWNTSSQFPYVPAQRTPGLDASMQPLPEAAYWIRRLSSGLPASQSLPICLSSLCISEPPPS